MESPEDPSPEVSDTDDVVPDSYIIILKDDVSESAFQAHQDWVCGICATARSSRGIEASDQPLDHTYNFGTFKGYAGAFDQETIDEICTREDVAYIESNIIMTTDGDEIPIEDDEIPIQGDEMSIQGDEVPIQGDEISAFEETTRSEPRIMASGRRVVQSPIPSWGLSAISHRSGSSSTNRYIHHSTAGSGVTVYVLDTGIRTTHRDFGGRARWGYNFIRGSPNTDIRGHGTHVSGTIAGTRHGVAKMATVVAVKVLGDNGRGPTSGIIAGLQWVVRNAPRGRAVANMSLGGSFSRASNQAVDNAVRAGVTVIVSAGNRNIDACRRSPASAAGAITVGATEQNLSRASFSNFGNCVNIFAPGTQITSCGVRSDTDTRQMRGTSMACPHVAGVAAFLIRLWNLNGPAAVRARLVASGTRNIVRNPGSGSTNLFLHNGSNVR